MLNFGFLVASKKLTLCYDHEKNIQFSSSARIIRELLRSQYPTIARLDISKDYQYVDSPVFEYTDKSLSVETRQSAYYLVDNLTEKGVVPVFLEKTDEVKDLALLLSGETKRKLYPIVSELRKKYINKLARSPKKSFLSKKEPKTELNGIEMSEKEILAVFGRLPERGIKKEESHKAFIPDYILTK